MVRTVAVNPSLLTWAREKAGLTLEEAAVSAGQSAEALAAWEAGERAPTYRQLEDLAYRIYKRPVAVFFFPEPPVERPIASEFRTLPESERERLAPDTLLAIRQARAWQLAIPEVMAGVEARPGHVSQLRVRGREGVSHLAARVRAALGVSIEEQRGWPSTEAALKGWRQAVEAFHVFVFKRSFAQGSVSGFSLDDDSYPLIMLHNGATFTRQLFTLLHELGHICFGVSGITTRDEGYLGSLEPGARDIEIACNRFASEVLVPPGQVELEAGTVSEWDERISRYAREYNVSREVVLRRLVDMGEIPAKEYDSVKGRWEDDYLRERGGGGGGSYYATQGAYLSQLYVSAAFDQYHRGRLTIGELSEHLQMKAQNVAKFEDYVLSHGLAE